VTFLKMPRARWAALSVGALVVAAALAAEVASSAGPHHDATSALHARAVSAAGASTKGDIVLPRCGPTTIGYVGVVRAGKASAARRVLGQTLVTSVADAASGQLDFARLPSGISSPAGSDFARWAPVLAQSRQSRLHSCDMLLSNRPAARPIINAAEAAVARNGYIASAARLRSELQEVLISDNPVAPHSVIVTLLVPGRAYRPIANAPVLHHLKAYTVIENDSTDHITAVAGGGF
jgi:hypothetical protein